MWSCSGSRHSQQVMWVGGFKTEADAGAGKMQVLQIHKGEDLAEARWENFYAPIEGFEFEEGMLQKIKVKESPLSPEAVPADASSIRYELVKVLDRQKDVRSELSGSWTLVRLMDQPLNRMVPVPTMQVNLGRMHLAANGGCNQLSAQIQSLTAGEIALGPVAGTRKMCTGENVEAEFSRALGQVKSYRMEGAELHFLDGEGKALLAFLPGAEPPNPRLHDIWVARSIGGIPLDPSDPAPSLELNLTDRRVMGNNGCNQFSGAIQVVTDSELRFGPLATTEMACPEMETPDRFDAALLKTATYQLKGLNLLLFGENGQELISFSKVD